jgi:uncharacterized protein (DUF302 family)
VSEPSAAGPAGAAPVPGMSHVRSLHSVEDTVERLAEAVRDAGAKQFTVVDHSEEAEKVGLSLRPTKLLIFGNPVGGTPLMVAAPLSAIDLPMKVLVWEDDFGAVWLSHLDSDWLAERHGLTAELAAPLAAAGKLAAKAAAP